jgi:uncharacterized protein with HEPN domain
MRADRLRLLDALDQIELIRKFAEPGREAFFRDILVQSALLHRLTLLGEAFRTLSPELRAAHPEIPWAQITAFRNVVVHEYFGIDLDLVWTIIAEQVPGLASSLEAILNSLSD